MRAISAEQHTLSAESELLIEKLLRVAKAVVHVEDRRADLLMSAATHAPIEEVEAITSHAASCRAVAGAATDLVVRVGAAVDNVQPPAAASLAKA
jgi:ribosomal protein L12E/L44/L45/RPP1/RPP2